VELCGDGDSDGGKFPAIPHPRCTLFSEFGEPENVIYELPEEYRPVADTKEDIEATKSGIARYDVTVKNIIDAGLLDLGERLLMLYKPIHGERKTYEGIVQEDGSIELLGKTFSSPSYAAIYGIQDAGSDRTTVNGWTSWKNAKNASLADLRDEYLKIRKAQVQAQDKYLSELPRDSGLGNT